MKKAVYTIIIVFLFILPGIYCYRAIIMNHFAVYESWKLIDEKIFAVFHQQHGKRVIDIFVLFRP